MRFAVTFVQHQPGSRTVRMARALTARGVRCHILTRNPLRHGEEAFETVKHWDSIPRLLALLLADGSEVWHVGQHMAVEWLTSLCLAARQQRALQGQSIPRIIHDARDMRSLTPHLHPNDPELPWEAVPYYEVNAFRCTDGVVHVSEECALNGLVVHRYPTPYAVVYSMCNEAEMPDLFGTPYRGPELRRGMVYSGGIQFPGRLDIRTYEGIWGRLAVVLRGLGEELTATCESSVHPETGRTLGEMLEEHGVRPAPFLPAGELLEWLTRFRWGFVGFQESFPLGQCAMPNKLFEYLAAGVVPVVFNCRAAADFVERHGVGVVCPLDEKTGKAVVEAVGPLLTEETHRRLFGRVAALRRTFTMESQVERLLELYRLALKSLPNTTPAIALGTAMHDTEAAPQVVEDLMPAGKGVEQ